MGKTAGVLLTDAILHGHAEELDELLLRDYGLRGRLGPLPGEVDANLDLVTDEATYLVKIAASTDPGPLQLQIAALEHVARTAPDLPIPRTVPTRSGAALSSIRIDGVEHPVWITTWLPGTPLSRRPGVGTDTLESLGRTLGRLDRALGTFDDARARRELRWNLLQSHWIEAHLEDVEAGWLRDVVTAVHDWFVDHRDALSALRQATVHNDANDHNILVAAEGSASITGLIDFGDMCHTALVGDLAIAASYAAMLAQDPFAAIDAVTRGFHAELPLHDEELAMVLPLVELRLAVSIVNAAVQAKRRPKHAYAQVSQIGARRVLRQLHGRDHHTGHQRLRAACGLPPSPHPQRIAAYVDRHRGQLPAVLLTPTPLERAIVLDLSFDSCTGGDDPIAFDATRAAERIRRTMLEADTDLALGRYAEPRPIYSDDAFGDAAPNGNRRTVHLGIDVFAPAGTSVATPLDAVVHDVDVCDGHLDYGGVVVLRHTLPDGTAFGTLYGHLDPDSLEQLAPGQRLAAGDPFAQLGDAEVNGGWPPHLHLQLLAADPRELPAVPRGVADPDDLEAHRLVHPDPSALLGLADDRAIWRDRYADLAQARSERFARNLATSYASPLTLVRGWRHFLFDQHGRRHLDAYNNVPHVGHCHPRVVRAVHEQTSRLATNTRYLHAGMQRYAERLRAWLPEQLEVFFFTPSGSEANELALRLARQHTDASDVCVMDHGYHGHTNAAMAMSPYKFRQPGAQPKPDWVHVTAQPDVYRGPHRGDDAGARYADDVAAEIRRIRAADRRIAAYLCECLPSVGGQLELPQGFLGPVYDAVRAAGGLCIADDVQTGLWRTGEHAFGFERHEVVPDLLVLGKPLGNGFPLGAVVTTRAIADSFANGPEFFSTFGGSTVAMAAGLAVLDVLGDEDLAANARAVGATLRSGLRELQARHEVIGDVRGRGFFLGVELVQDRDSREPATDAAARIKNLLRERRVLIGTDGPFDSVLKIRPPMTFDASAAACLLDELDRAFASVR
ncbi:MAG: aminotransferase class III-fold pyridoxal phosphate-dependent enzyme [Planctomycetota bacterium]